MNTEQHQEPPQWALWRGMRLEADMKWHAATPAARPGATDSRPMPGLSLANGAMRVTGARHE